MIPFDSIPQELVFRVLEARSLVGLTQLEYDQVRVFRQFAVETFDSDYYRAHWPKDDPFLAGIEWLLSLDLPDLQQ